MTVDTKRVPVTQVASDLGIPRRYVQRWLDRGELDSIRFGPRGMHLVRPADVRALMTGTSPAAHEVAGNNSLPLSSLSADNRRYVKSI